MKHRQETGVGVSGRESSSLVLIKCDAYRSFVDRFSAALSQQRNTPRQVLSMGLGALAITDGSPSAAAASAVAPSVAVPPAEATAPLSFGQQEVRPAPVGLLQTPGCTATVVEINDDDEMMVSDEETDGDEEMDGDRCGEEMDVGVDDGGEMGEEDDESFDIDLGGEELCEDRDEWLAELRTLGPVRVTKGSPELCVRMLGSNGKKQVAYMAKLAEVKSEKRRCSPSVHDEVTPPSAKRVKETPRSFPGQAEPSPPTSHETGSARKASLRAQERLWQKFIDERERWEVASIDESCDRSVKLSHAGEQNGRAYDRSSPTIVGPVVLPALLAPAPSAPPIPLGIFLPDLLLLSVPPTLRPPLFVAVSPQPKTGTILCALLRQTSPLPAPPRRHPPSVARLTLPWPDRLVSLLLLWQVRLVVRLAVLLPPPSSPQHLWLAHLVSRLPLLPVRLVPPGAVLLLRQLKRSLL
ncbi:hypothetical protein TREMEDRAFT_59173 [Tremella mesenterica DSM 1558]|uniref:uncharacterized protein n=1 Tax=Tremella mesenterica (strain ATCC 24925 / CBS 8224 / DSM 1558 / NBRC 9311 / NRRL Y-6157 / RJB 2259-6 / UBC 559-6) TaxID=578456 RepID=UPI0003F48FFC|nr:uncharacterized protein TREMEDRAFT_59173 [Tremella mesenterica DSM 1558]EIW73011.1 hypothetical protein TREMEDRAFT_59173 [Tremella mesenterica DSM 1558]